MKSCARVSGTPYTCVIGWPESGESIGILLLHFFLRIRQNLLSNITPTVNLCGLLLNFQVSDSLHPELGRIGVDGIADHPLTSLGIS